MRSNLIRVLLVCISILGFNTYSISQYLYPIFDNNNNWGFIDTQGEVIIKPQFDSVTYFQEGFAGVKYDNLWGFVDTLGKTIIEPTFEKVYPFSEDIALVKSDSLYGYISKDGSYLITPKYLDAFSFSEGRAIVMNFPGNWIIIDSIGTLIKDLGNKNLFHYQAERFSSSPFFYSGILKTLNCISGIANYYNSNGDIVNVSRNIPYYSGFSNEVILFEKRNYIGYQDLENKVVIHAQYLFGSKFLDNYAWVIDTLENGYKVKHISKLNNANFNIYLNNFHYHIYHIVNISDRACKISYYNKKEAERYILIIYKNEIIMDYPLRKFASFVLNADKHPCDNNGLREGVFLIMENNHYKYINNQGDIIWSSD